MRVITRPTVAALLLLTLLIATAVAQQKRQAPARPQPKPAAAPVPPPTFDTLVPAESYTIYGEVRGVGQLIQSSAINEALEPILKLAGPPKEFRNACEVVESARGRIDDVAIARGDRARSAKIFLRCSLPLNSNQRKKLRNSQRR